MLRKIVTGLILSVMLSALPLIAAPSNPNATKGAKDLLLYLESISGKKILSGQESMWSDGTFPSTRDQYVHTKTGKYPAVYASDFGDFGTGNLADRKKVVSNVIAYSRAGSIISIQYHMVQPDLADGAGFTAMNIPGSSYTKIDDILTAGSTLNTTFKQRLDELAGYLAAMQDSGVTVLFRPYHEMNGDWFWWSFQPRYKDLWIYTWKYLAQTKQLNNLLWVFSANYWSGSAEKSNPRYYYPGNEYVDVLGCDVYTNYGHSYSKACHDSLRALGGGKPIAITENGTFPTDFAAWRSEQPYWVYWLTWWGFEGTDKGNTDALYTQVYGHASVITQDKISPADTNVRIVRVTTEGSGTVAKTPNSLTYAKGAQVTVTAVPAEGWKFTGWTGSVTSQENPITVTVNADQDLTAHFEPLPGTLVNLIGNGDFSKSATTGWSQLAAYEGAAATGSIVNGEYVAAITGGGSEEWHVQLTYNDIRLEQNKVYTLSFNARASAQKSVFVKIGENGGEYTQYTGKTLDITTAATQYKITFTMTEATDPAARLEFNIGKNNATLYLDDVVLVEGTGTGTLQQRMQTFGSTGITFRVTPQGLRYSFDEPQAKTLFSVYSVNGRLMVATGNHSGCIDRMLLPSGCYVVKARSGNRSFTRPVMLY